VTNVFDFNALYAALEAQRQARGWSLAQLARAVGVSAATIEGMRERAAVEGDGVLQMLRWLGQSPESFQPGGGDDNVALPIAPAAGVLRFDAPAIHAALDARRTERGLTWQDVAAECGIASASSLTRLRRGGRVTFPDVMRIFAWLGQPAARFVRIAPR